MNANEYLKININTKDSSVLSAEVKMLKGKTAIILVEGKDDFEFYNQIFKKNIVRSCFTQEELEDFNNDLINKYYNKDFKCDGIEKILKSDDVKRYQNIIGIGDKDYITVDIDNNKEVIPSSIPHLFYVDKHDLETTIYAFDKCINNRIDSNFTINIRSIISNIIDICMQIAAVRYVNYTYKDKEGNSYNVSKKGIDNISKCLKFDYSKNIIEFDFELFCDFVDGDNNSRKKEYYKMYNKFVSSSLDNKLLIVGHDLVTILSKYIVGINTDLTMTDTIKEIKQIIFDKDNSDFESTIVIKEIKEYQDKILNDTVFID